MKYLTFSKLINHYNKSFIEIWTIFSVLLIVQLIKDFSPPGKFISAQLII